MILIFINFTTKTRITTYATFWIFVTSYPTLNFIIFIILVFHWRNLPLQLFFGNFYQIFYASFLADNQTEKWICFWTSIRNKIRFQEQRRVWFLFYYSYYYRLHWHLLMFSVKIWPKSLFFVVIWIFLNYYVKKSFMMIV